MSKPILPLTFLLCLLATSLPANHIDFVVDGGFLLTTNSTLGSTSDTQTGDPGNILGGERDVTLDFASGAGFLSTGTLNVPVGPGPVGPDTDKILLFDNSVSSLGTLTLVYDGVGNAGLGGLDFDTNWDAIDVRFEAVQGAGDLKITVTDTLTNSGMLTQNVSSDGVFSFPFNDPGYAGVNFTSVDSVKVELITTIAASDFSISQITREAVPEPAGNVLLISALLPFLWLRRRHR